MISGYGRFRPRAGRPFAVHPAINTGGSDGAGNEGIGLVELRDIGTVLRANCGIRFVHDHRCSGRTTR